MSYFLLCQVSGEIWYQTWDYKKVVGALKLLMSHTSSWYKNHAVISSCSEFWLQSSSEGSSGLMTIPLPRVCVSNKTPTLPTELTKQKYLSTSFSIDLVTNLCWMLLKMPSKMLVTYLLFTLALQESQHLDSKVEVVYVGKWKAAEDRKVF